MGKIAIEDLIQLFGMVGIIGSLIFVGLEMQQSQRIAVASQQQERAAITVDMINAFYEVEVDVDFQSTYFDKEFNYQLSTEEIAYRNMVHKGWLLYENDFYQYKQGLMDELTWEAKLRGISVIYNSCDVRNIYDSRAPIFSEDFRLVVEALPNQCERKS
ncbi:MAG: hypothetical protein VYD10_03925 [Actinomycetota bacterium]|nr:hypothetical protein [Actinomycetota bacterium]